MNQKTKPIKRGISYARVSTINQLLDSNGNQREDSSPVAQKARCDDHARFLSTKTGTEYQIIQHYSDEGFSAKNVNRPGYKEVWKMISKGTINFIISSELSRLSRSVADFLDLVSHCQKHNVDLIIIGLDLDTSTPFGRVIVIILIALAQFEREMTSMRVKENALTRLLNDGKINGSKEILGLDRDKNRPGHFKRNEEELIRVATVMQLFMDLPSKIQVLKKIQELNITNKYNAPLVKTALDTLLNNAHWRYRGLWEANKENKYSNPELLAPNKRYQIINLPHGPLIDINLLDQVVKKMDMVGHKFTKAVEGIDKHFYLLSAVLVFEDGSTFYGESTKKAKYRYYYNKTNVIRINCEYMEEKVRSCIKDVYPHPYYYKEMINLGLKKIAEELPYIDKLIGKYKFELRKMLEEEEAHGKKMMNWSATNDGDEFMLAWNKQKLGRLAKERQGMETIIRQLENLKWELKRDDTGDIKNLGESLFLYVDDKVYNELDRAHKRALVEKLVQKIVMTDRNEIKIKLHNPWQYILPNLTISNSYIREANGKVSELGIDGGCTRSFSMISSGYALVV